MAKQFKTSEQLSEWIKLKNEELYPCEDRDIWDIDPCPMSDEEIINALIADGYTDLDNLVQDGHAYEIGGHTNNGWLYIDEANLDCIKEMGLDVELRERDLT